MKAKILIVDDDDAVLEFLQAKLGKRYELVTTMASDAVVSIAKRQRPDLILCDIDMPGADGGDVSAALFGDAALRDIPVLFLTALATPEEIVDKEGQLGGRPAISKRAPVEQIVARIEALLKK
jgi:CheY-like chemotaxis protein